jgi:predicted ester cyclase
VPAILRPAGDTITPLLALKSKKARAADAVLVSISRQEAEFVRRSLGLPIAQVTEVSDLRHIEKGHPDDQTGRQQGHRWPLVYRLLGKTCKLGIVDELAAPDMLLQYSLHEPRRGRDDIKAFMADFRAAFPDLNFWGTADLIAEGDYVVGRWEGGGTHTGPAFSDFLIGTLPAATGLKMRFTGTTVLRLQNGKIVEEIGLDDGVTALTQLGLLKAA